MGDSMRKPRWITIVGVLGILFGIMGLLGAGQLAMTPKVMEMQKNMFKAMSEISRETGKPHEAGKPDVGKVFEKVSRDFIGDVPSWFSSVAVALGVVAFILNAFYVWAAVSILQIKPGSDKLFSSVLLASILLSVIRIVVFLNASFIMGMGVLFFGGVGIVLDVILLLLIATGDKRLFYQASAA